MTKMPLKKLRLTAGMTQTEVAQAMGVSQPNYQRWESGSAPVPAAKQKKLARVLKASVDELLGKPAAFDLFGIDETVSDDRTYFGEVAVHFADNCAILLPISEAMREALFEQLQGTKRLIIAESLDNRIVFIRREAISDVYFSSEAYDTYGPDTYDDHLGVLPDDSFWTIVEHIDMPELIADEFDQEEIENVTKEVRLTESDIDDLISSGKLAASDRETTAKAAEQEFAKLHARATETCWKISAGPMRHEVIFDNTVLHECFSLLQQDPDCVDDMIYLPVEGYHRSILIRMSTVDFISIPKHKFNAGSLETVEEELDQADAELRAPGKQ